MFFHYYLEDTFWNIVDEVGIFILFVLAIFAFIYCIKQFLYNTGEIPVEAKDYIGELIELKKRNKDAVSDKSIIFLITYMKTRSSSYPPTKSELQIALFAFEQLNEEDKKSILDNTYSEVSLLTSYLKKEKEKSDGAGAVFLGAATASILSSTNKNSSKKE
ncbi:MAG: hypothetical protein ACRCXT_00550 [Paraclostridium sp.]